MTSRWFLVLSSGLASLLLAVRCGSVKPFAYDSPQTYFSTMTNMVVEVIYEPGAEPAEGPLGGVGPLATIDVWSIVEDNLVGLFAGRASPPTFTIPTRPQWRAVAEQNQAGWTITELAALIGANRVGTSTETTAYFTVAFVKGRFEDADGVNNSVLGVNLTGTPLVAIFKDTVQEAAATSTVRKFVEQTTLVHELGHALGLVNGGIPMAVAHQDTDHGAHCSNTECVMFWQNQTKENIETFVTQYLTGGETVMFGDECIADVTAYTPAVR